MLVKVTLYAFLAGLLNAEFHLLIESVVDRLELQRLVEVPLMSTVFVMVS